MYRVLSWLERRIRHLRWNYTRSGRSNRADFRVHLLCVKNPVYAKIAQVCVESFLFHHPAATVIVHCDEATVSAAEDLLGRSRRGRKASVVATFEGSVASWQEHKVDLILSMNGTSDIFIDADLRWNGPIPRPISGITLFVNEFDMTERSPYLQVVRRLAPGLTSAHMYNTSFFTFGSVDVGSDLLANVRSELECFPQTLEHSDLGRSDLDQLMRIREQIVLGVSLQIAGLQISTLKDSDTVRDGAFVESSYFGATGSSF